MQFVEKLSILEEGARRLWLEADEANAQSIVEVMSEVCEALNALLIDVQAMERLLYYEEVAEDEVEPDAGS